MKTVIVTAFVFFQAFGIKLGPVDLTVLSSLLIAAIVLHRATVLPVQLQMILFLMFFFGWTVLVSSIGGVIETYSINRYLRLLVSSILLAVVVNGIPLKWDEVLRAINGLLLLHAAFIYAQILSPTLKETMRPFLFEAGPIDPWGLASLWRAYGIVGSYDLASLYVAIGMLTSSYFFFAHKGSYWNVAALFFLWGAGLFTGRTFMLLGTALLGLISLRLYLLGNLRLRLSLGLLIAVGLGLFVHYFGDLLILSLGLADQAESTAEYASLAEKGYYSGSLGTLSNSFALPGSVSTILFGTENTPEWTDNGYLKIIYTHGVVGLIVLIGFYIFMVSGIVRDKRFHSLFSAEPAIVLGVTALIFLYNYKIILFGSRNISELYLLLIYTLLRKNATGPDRCA